MSTHNDIFNGLSQFERIKKELDPDFVKIDDRSLPDLLEFVRKYSSLINFIEPEHFTDPERPADQWNSFFERDNLILLISISNYKITETESLASRYIDSINNFNDQEAVADNLNLLVQLILEIGQKLDYFSTHLTTNELTQDIVFDIKSAIKTDLNEKLRTLYQFKDLAKWDGFIERDFTQLLFNWNKGTSILALKKELLADEIPPTDLLRDVFYTFYYTCFHFVENSTSLLKHILNNVENAKPHIALLIAFLKLYKFSQDQLNQLSKKHLEFYYRDVLHQSEQKAKPDHVLLSVGLKPNIEQFKLNKGTTFSAGENERQEEITYSTDKEYFLSQSKIAKVCTLMHTVDERYHQKPFKSFITDSHFAEVERSESKHLNLNNLAPFGEEQIMNSKRNFTMHEAKQGFIIASPVLSLKSGLRSIQVDLEFEKEGFKNQLSFLKKLSKQRTEPFEETSYRVFSTGFDLSISNKENLQKVKHYGFILNEQKCSWSFQISLDVEDKAIESCLKTPERYPDISAPFIEVLLRHECSLYLFDILNELCLKNIKIKTDSRDVRGIQIYNELGPVNSNKAFELFGLFPQKGSQFTIGHPEVFSKKIDTLNLNLHWSKVPFLDGGIPAYFEEFKQEELESKIEEDLSTDLYKIQASLLWGAKWQNIATSLKSNTLFRNKTDKGLLIKDQYSDSLVFNIDLSETSQKPFSGDGPYFFNEEVTSGFIRFNLDCPEFAFGHHDHTNVLAEVLQRNAQPKRKKPSLKPPKALLTPMVDQITLDYTASTEAVSKLKSRSEAESIDIYEIGPFGYKPKSLNRGKNNATLLSKPTGQGNLLLGFDQYLKEGLVSLLLVINEELEINSINKNHKVQWSFLANNEWSSFPIENVISDSTNGMIRSGIIQLKIPSEINQNNTVIDKQYLWIKASVASDVLSHGKLISIHENGIKAIWNEENTPIHIKHKIAAESISSTKENIPQIDTVYQPIQSLGGREAEKNSNFYKRVSERLSHKNRAINLIDYEQIVLQRFNSLYMAKCFTANHTLKESYKSDRNFFPGSVKLVVVPYLEASINNSYPRFSVSALEDIQAYFKSKVSPFVNLDVANAHFQKVRVICKARFEGPETSTYYKNQLEKEILHYLNPWLKDYTKELSFGKSVFKSELLTFLEKLPYVNYITEFSMVNIKQRDSKYSFYDTAVVNNATKENPNELKPDYPWSVLVSAQKHDIGIIDDSSYRAPKRRSISNMELGVDFIISE